MAQPKQAVLDSDIREAVITRLASEASLKTARIDIEVDRGIVTLNGLVDRKGDMLAAERAAMAVGTVRGIADLLETRHESERSGKEIVEDIFRALNSNITVQAERIKVTVAAGKVTLEGVVDSQFQKLMAESIVKRIQGITGVINNIQVIAVSTAQNPRPAAAEQPTVELEI